MPRIRRRKSRGYKAFDPFCTDKLRVALYKRPSGPHIGQLIPGKTRLDGLDDKFISQTGRIKPGYDNIPIDVQREFRAEKRAVRRIQSIVNFKPRKKKRHEDFGDDISKLKRGENETFHEFTRRVNRTAATKLKEMNNKPVQKILKKQKKRIQKKVDIKLLKKKAKKRAFRQKKEAKRNAIVAANNDAEKWDVNKEVEFMSGKLGVPTKMNETDFGRQRDHVFFGETNEAPPDLKQFMNGGSRLRKPKPDEMEQEKKINVRGLSFAKNIQDRERQLELERVKQNYEQLKKKRRAKELKEKQKMAKRRKLRKN